MRSKPFFTRRSYRWVMLIGLTVALMPGARADDAVSGTWEGSYRCDQGNTALILDLQPGARSGKIEGLFYFHESADNPGVPQGCFAMAGSVDSRSREVRLTAGRWLLQPFGYVTVDLVGQLDLTGKRLSGRVIGPLCRGYELHRLKSGPATIPPACLGGAMVAAMEVLP